MVSPYNFWSFMKRILIVSGAALFLLAATAWGQSADSGDEVDSSYYDDLDYLDYLYGRASSGDSTLDLAGSFIDLELYDAAREILTEYIGQNSANAEAYYLLGFAYDRTDNLAEAMKNYNLALTINPKHWGANRDKGYLFDIYVQYDSMNYYLRNAMNFSPEPESLYYDFGFSFDQLNQLDSAMYYYYKAAAVDSNDYDAYVNIGAIWAAWDNLDSSRYYTSKALYLNPRQSAANYNYGIILMSDNRHNDAIAYLQKGLSLSPPMLAARVRLGECYEALGDNATARQYYQQFMESATPDLFGEAEKARTRLDALK